MSIYKYHESQALNKIIEAGTLQEQIQNSNITIAIDGIIGQDGYYDIIFKAELPIEDGYVLDNLITIHDGKPLTIKETVILDELKDEAGRLIFVQEPRTGSEVIYATHNFCDKTTWYGDSTRVDNEVLIDSGDGYVFNSNNINWIDMRTGRLLDDDKLAEDQKIFNPEDPHGYEAIVKADGYLKGVHDIFETTGADYEIFYDDGYIKFEESQTGKDITASYSYESGSTFYAIPFPGKTLKIEGAEADFSSDIEQRDTIEYAVWGFVDVFAPQYLQSNGGPYPPGTKIPIASGKYKRYTQILREAVGSYPILNGNGINEAHKNLSLKEFRRQSRGGRRSMQSVPFRYGTIRSLYSDYGMELRVKLSKNKEFNGESSTITFYCTSANKGS